MIKQMETTCYENMCDYKPDTDYDYFIFSITFLMAIAFIANI